MTVSTFRSASSITSTFFKRGRIACGSFRRCPPGPSTDGCCAGSARSLGPLTRWYAPSGKTRQSLQTQRGQVESGRRRHSCRDSAERRLHRRGPPSAQPPVRRSQPRRVASRSTRESSGSGGDGRRESRAAPGGLEEMSCFRDVPLLRGRPRRRHSATPRLHAISPCFSYRQPSRSCAERADSLRIFRFAARRQMAASPSRSSRGLTSFHGVSDMQDNHPDHLTALADFGERRRSCGIPSEPGRPTESHPGCDAERPTKVEPVFRRHSRSSESVAAVILDHRDLTDVVVRQDVVAFRKPASNQKTPVAEGVL